MHIMVLHLPFLVKLEFGNVGFCGKRQLAVSQVSFIHYFEIVLQGKF